MASLTIGIAGFTGKFARLLTSSLLKSDASIRIKGLARDPAKVDTAISSRSNVEVLQGDAFDADKIRTFVRGCDVVVCCYLGDDHIMVEGQKLLIDVAEEENVTRYVASDWSLDWTKLQLGELFAKEPCQLVKAYVDTKKRIQGVHILVGGFTEVLFAPFFQIWDADKLTLKYWGTGDENWEFTTYLNSAQYTAAVILDSQAKGVLRCTRHPLSQMALTANHLISCRRRKQHPRHGKDLRESLWCQTEVEATGLFGRIAFQDACGATKVWCGLLQICFSVSHIRHCAQSRGKR